MSPKVFDIPDTVKPKLRITHNETLQSEAIKLLDRVDSDSARKSTQELILDDSNKVTFPGYPYTFEACNEQIIVSIDVFKTGYECKTCDAKKVIEVKKGRESVTEMCPDCKGIGFTLLIPESSKKLPGHGVVVSIGPNVPRDKINFKVGDRILFGEHAGTMIPTQAGLMFKYMDWYSAKIKIEGADNMSAFEFIITEE